MAKNYIQPGNVLDYVAGAAIASGDVVEMDKLVGVAMDDIANGDTGAVAISGVFEVPKNNTQAFAQGALIYWDGSQATTTSTANTFMGYAADASATADTVGNVLLAAATV